MNRRNFMRAILGTAAATALPSEVWPFRKIFLPASPIIYPSMDELFPDPMALRIAAVQAIELEEFAKGIPVLFANTTFTQHFKHITRDRILRGSGSCWDEVSFMPKDLHNAKDVESAKAANLLMRAGILP